MAVGSVPSVLTLLTSLGARALLQFLAVTLGFMKKHLSDPRCENGWTALTSAEFERPFFRVLKERPCVVVTHLVNDLKETSACLLIQFTRLL